MTFDINNNSEILVNETEAKYKNGGNEELLQDLYSKIKYPTQECISGLTILQITIDTLGYVINPTIKKSISKFIDDQLIDEICNYKFIPAELNGRKIESILLLPFRICIEK